MKTLVPTLDRILVKPHEEDDTTEGGIILSAPAVKNPHIMTGEVIDHGPGLYSSNGEKLEIRDITAGDSVVFGRSAGVDLFVNGERHRLLREGDILGVITR